MPPPPPFLKLHTEMTLVSMMLTWSHSRKNLKVLFHIVVPPLQTLKQHSFQRATNGVTNSTTIFAAISHTWESNESRKGKLMWYRYIPMGTTRRNAGSTSENSGMKKRFNKVVSVQRDSQRHPEPWTEQLIFRIIINHELFLTSLTSALFPEEPAGNAYQEHDHNNGLILKISNDIHIAVFSSVVSYHRIRLGNMPVVAWIIVLVRVVGRESVHDYTALYLWWATARFTDNDKGKTHMRTMMLNASVEIPLPQAHL